MTDFVRKAKEHAARIKATRKPEILTINGWPELVVQDADSYQKMLDELEQARFVLAILEGERAVSEGRIQEISEAFADIRKDLGL